MRTRPKEPERRLALRLDEALEAAREPIEAMVLHQLREAWRRVIPSADWEAAAAAAHGPVHPEAGLPKATVSRSPYPSMQNLSRSRHERWRQGVSSVC